MDPRKNGRKNRKRRRSNICILLFIASHLVVLNTIAVSVTATVDGEENDSGILPDEEQEINAPVSSHDLGESGGVQGTEASNNDDATNLSDLSPNDDMTAEVHSSISPNEPDAVHDGDSSTSNSNTETNPEPSPTNSEEQHVKSEDEAGSFEKTTKAKNVEVEKKKNMEGSIRGQSAEDDIKPVEDPPPSSKRREVVSDVQKKTEMGDPAKNQEVENKETKDESDSASPSSSEPIVSKPEEVQKEATANEEEEEGKSAEVSLEGKSKAVEPETEKEIGGDDSTPVFTDESAGDASSAGDSSMKNVGAEDDDDHEVSENATLDDDEADKPVELQGGDQKEEGEEKIETKKVQEKATIDEEGVDKPIESPDREQKEEGKEESDTKTETVDSNETPPMVQPKESENTEPGYPVYESGSDSDDSVIDLDVDPDSEAKKNTLPEETKEDQTEESGTDSSSNMVIKDKQDDDDSNNGGNEKVQETSSPGTSDPTTDEAPSATAANSYRGEPWGQYRLTRRLPDMELLRLVFENTKNGAGNPGNGDSKSQQVVENWQKNPLYDANSAIDTEKRLDEPLIGEEADSEFADYRSRLLGENKIAGGVDINSGNKNNNEGSTKQTEKIKNGTINQSNDNSNNVDVNAEFVEGLDDIDDFFEGVDPPDELDVGYGSSIQDVLMDKGKHILLKKIRGAAQWIRIGWQGVVRNLEERISQFQLPLQKLQGTINSSSAAEASNITPQSEERGDTGSEGDMKEKIISAWKTGKRAFEQMSDWVDGLLDRLDRSEGDSATFDDFNNFDLDNLSNLSASP